VLGKFEITSDNCENNLIIELRGKWNSDKKNNLDGYPVEGKDIYVGKNGELKIESCMDENLWENLNSAINSGSTVITNNIRQGFGTNYI
jgi:hypothetical protein